MNTLKTKEKVKVEKETGKVSKSLSSFLSGDFLSHKSVAKSLPYIFFLTFLGIIYIANGYYMERAVKNIYRVGGELKELRSEYITTKSDLNFNSKQSQVAEKTERLGVKESVFPPNKIIVTDREMKKMNGN